MEKCNSCVILGNKSEIFAVNPNNRMQLRVLKIKRDCERIVDIYSSSNGVYHAVKEIIKSYTTKADRKYGHFFYNACAKVYDSIIRKSVFTAIDDAKPLTLEEIQLEEFKFNFIKEGESLLYRLNDKTGAVFEKINGVSVQSGRIRINDKEAYFGQKRIARLEESILHSQEVDMALFEYAFRSKNKERYRKNKAFFKIQ